MEDEKLIALLDERFGKVDLRFAQIDERFARMDDRFAKMDDQFATMNAKVEKLSDDLTEPTGTVAQRFAAMDRRLDDISAEARQAHVEIEGVRGQVEGLAEVIKGVDRRLERFRGETDANFEEVKQRIDMANEQLGKRITDLEHATG